jgi:hypothetical protein
MTTTLITGETWGEERDTVRAYFLEQSDRPMAELRPRLEAARRDFDAAIENVSDAQAAFAPGTGEGEDAWGIVEVLRHIGRIEPTMAERIRLLAAGQSAVGIVRAEPSYLADVARVADLRRVLDQSYATLQSALATLDGTENVDTMDTHRQFGDLNCRGWVALHAAHLADHARQIQRIRALPGFPKAQTSSRT